jgi:hypothetical protein
MVDRVLMKGGALASLQVSLPGFDVNTATLDQMAFDARFSNTSLIMSGSVYVPAETWTTVYFPQSYSTIPRVFCAYNDGGGANPNPDTNPVTVTAPLACLTSGGGTYLGMDLCQVTNSYMQFYAALFDDPSDPNNALIRSFANAYFWYSVYR